MAAEIALLALLPAVVEIIRIVLFYIDEMGLTETAGDVVGDFAIWPQPVMFYDGSLRLMRVERFAILRFNDSSLLFC